MDHATFHDWCLVSCIYLEFSSLTFKYKSITINNEKFADSFNSLISQFVNLLKSKSARIICHCLVFGIKNRFIRFDFPTINFEECLLEDNCIRSLGELDNLLSVDSHSVDVELSELYDLRSS